MVIFWLFHGGAVLLNFVSLLPNAACRCAVCQNDTHSQQRREWHVEQRAGCTPKWTIFYLKNNKNNNKKLRWAINLIGDCLNTMLPCYASNTDYSGGERGIFFPRGQYYHSFYLSTCCLAACPPLCLSYTIHLSPKTSHTFQILHAWSCKSFAVLRICHLHVTIICEMRCCHHLLSLWIGPWSAQRQGLKSSAMIIHWKPVEMPTADSSCCLHCLDMVS